MKKLICLLSTVAVAGVAPQAASAADLGGGYEERGYVEDRPPPPPEPRYYYEEEAPPPVVYYRRYPRPYPYYADYYGWGPRWPYWHRPYWRAHYWGPHRRW